MNAASERCEHDDVTMRPRGEAMPGCNECLPKLCHAHAGLQSCTLSCSGFPLAMEGRRTHDQPHNRTISQPLPMHTWQAEHELASSMCAGTIASHCKLFQATCAVSELAVVSLREHAAHISLPARWAGCSSRRFRSASCSVCVCCMSTFAQPLQCRARAPMRSWRVALTHACIT